MATKVLIYQRSYLAPREINGAADKFENWLREKQLLAMASCNHNGNPFFKGDWKVAIDKKAMADQVVFTCTIETNGAENELKFFENKYIADFDWELDTSWPKVAVYSSHRWESVNPAVNIM